MSLFEKSSAKTFLKRIYCVAVMAMQNLVLESFLKEFEGTFFQKSSLIASFASPTNRNLFKSKAPL